jgi:hypothetical protein
VHRQFASEAQKAIAGHDNSNLQQFGHLPGAIGLVGGGHDMNAA